jgi:hypothetical protein
MGSQLVEAARGKKEFEERYSMTELRTYSCLSW